MSVSIYNFKVGTIFLMKVEQNEIVSYCCNSYTIQLHKSVLYFALSGISHH